MVLRRSRDPQSRLTIHSVALISTCGCHPSALAATVASDIGMIMPVSGRAIMFVRMNCVGNVPKYM